MPGVALTPDHVMRIGSLTKSYTAALILKLAEEGLLTLDDPLELWGLNVPDAALITVRMLLNHTSGLNDYQYNDEFLQANMDDPERVWQPQELVDYAVALPPVGVPGDKHAYSNANYILAALIAEQAAGQGYAEALRMHVLAPGGLMHTYVEADESWAEPTATGYVVVAMGPPQETTGFYHASQTWSAGAMNATIDDLRAWIAVLLASDFLSADSQGALVDFVPAAGTKGYGLGVFAVNTADATLYGHNGAVMGFQAAAFHEPETGSTVAVIHNQLTLDVMGNLSSDPTLLALQIVETIRAQ
jgi:D-alanyl-D-alanine carboxypeptidase